MNSREYLDHLSAAYQLRANPEKAAYMKKYMLGQYAYFGLAAPERRELQKQFIRDHGLPGPAELEEITMALWSQPEREFQYFAMEMLEKYRKKVPENFIATYEKMILGKSWWDTVDYIAAVLVGEYFKRFPGAIVPVTSKWMSSGNMWLQRTCILFQLKYKKQTDFELLTSFILPVAGSKEFFLRKAIGWALREYSKTDPSQVTGFVHAVELSNLSRKEALRRIKI